MNRSQYLAIVIALAAIGALAAVRLVGTGDDTEAADSTEAAAAGSADSTEAAAAGSAAETGTDGDSADDSADDSDSDGAADSAALEVPDPPPVLDDKPDLVDIDGWLNTDATGLDDFAGQVTVVEFWTFGCFNCKNRLPHTKELYAEYRDQGMEIVAVHSPEFDYERDPAAVAEAAEELGVVWPIALDTDKINFRAWQGSRRFWPRVYVFDQDGQLRYDHIGEGDYDGLEAVVDYLVNNGP